MEEIFIPLNKKNIPQIELDKALKRENELKIMIGTKHERLRKRRKPKLPKTLEEYFAYNRRISEQSEKEII